RRDPVGEILTSFPKRKVVNETDLRIVSDIELADRFLKSAIVLICPQTASSSSARSIRRDAITPITVCIRQEFRKNVRSLKSESSTVAFFETKESSMVSGVSAVIALASVGVNERVLRIGSQRLFHGTSEPRIGRHDSVLVR